LGGSAGVTGSAGGNGGAATSIAGQSAPAATNKPSGGGGGAVGRIAFKTLSGMIRNDGAILSPNLTDTNSAAKSPAVIGTATFQ
jgi:hypothetical protein